MVLNRILFTIITLTVFSVTAKADILFEGYSKVLSGSVQIGYVVSRIEFDDKKKEFVSIYYLKTNELGGNITESLKARSNNKLVPISYQYTSVVGTKTKVIDATFKGQKMQATITEDGKVEKVNRDVPKGTFLSTFLAYMMLQGKEGIKPDVKYEYQAIAEEDAVVYKGVAFVKGLEDYGGIKAYRVLNEFKNTRFVSFATEKGEALATKSPAQSIATELVANASLATTGFAVNNSALSLLFGSVPLGQRNAVSENVGKAMATKGDASRVKESPKFGGVPGGKGIIIKPEAPTSAAPENPPAHK